MTYFQSIKSKMSAGLSFKVLGVATILVAAFLMLAPRQIDVSRAENCTNAPETPTFNPFALTFQDPPESCKDYPLIRGRVSGGQYPQNEQQLNAGVTASNGQEVESIIYFHNGAKENLDPNQTTAKNFKIKTVVDTNNAGTDHTVTVTLSADNATSLTKTMVIHTAANEKIEVVENSGILYDFQANVVQSGFNVANQTLNMQDLLACFSHSGFVKFKVRVVSTSTLSDNAVCVNFASVPALNPGQAFNSQVTLRNTGTTTWTEAQRYALRTTQSTNLGVPDLLQIPGVAGVAPNQQVTFNINGTAPQAPGTYSLSVQLVKNGVVFGAVCPLTIVVNGTNPSNPYLTITKHVRSVTNGGGFSTNVNVNSGTTVEYKIVVTANVATVNNLVVTDNFPNGLSYIPNTLTVNGQPHATGLSTGGLQLGSLSAGQSVTIMYQATVNAIGGTIVNTATAYGSNASQVQAQATVTVNQVNPTPIVCTPNAQNVNVNQAAYFTASGGNGNYTWYAQDGNPSSGYGSSFSTSYYNQGTRNVTVSSNGSSAVCTVNVTGVVAGGNVNLNYSKRAWNDTRNVDAVTANANRGDFITYTLTVSNTGNTAANNFVITDDLSQVLDKADLVDNGGATLNGKVLTFPGVNIPANGSVSKSFKVKVKTTLANNTTYVMSNTYGNTVNINITTPAVAGAFVAPTTGASGLSAAVFAALMTLGFVAYKKKEAIMALILN